MAVFVLVHGAFHGAWCWTKLLPELERLGHRSVAIDLPGSGDDPTPPESVTLDGYVARIGAAIAASPEPVVLVGHSIGGIAATAAAERHAERVGGLVYLAAFIPRDGQSLYTLVNPDLPPGAEPPPDSRWSAPSVDIDAASARDVFYHDCGEDDVRFALARLRPQPNRPRTTPVSVTAARFGRIPRSYVACTEDKAVSPATQRRMVEETPCGTVVRLAGGHSPFFSRPAELARVLSSLA